MTLPWPSSTRSASLQELQDPLVGGQSSPRNPTLKYWDAWGPVPEPHTGLSLILPLGLNHHL